jgi:hypothetical protein
MGKTTEKIDEKIIKEVEREFHGDPAFQQIHIARKLISQKAKKLGVSLHEYITRQSAGK